MKKDSRDGELLMSEFQLDHIGIAVDSLDTGNVFYKTLGMHETHREEVSSEKVKVSFFPLGNAANIELLEGTSDESPIRKFLQKRGPGVHHICLRVKNIDALVEKLKQNKVKLINETPRRGAHNCRVVFVHPTSAGGVLVELSEPGE